MHWSYHSAMLSHKYMCDLLKDNCSFKETYDVTYSNGMAGAEKNQALNL